MDKHTLTLKSHAYGTHEVTVGIYKGENDTVDLRFSGLPMGMSFQSIMTVQEAEKFGQDLSNMAVRSCF